jgi:CRISPR-associated endonuclease Csn1
MHRGTRRHVERRKKRIRLIRELFAEEVLKKDPLFYKRLDQAQLQKGDKEKALGKFTLFNDVDGSFTDFDYHKKFPTIYHLRKALLDKNHDDHEFAISDIRLVFLACEHIVKYRGNFLYDD